MAAGNEGVLMQRSRWMALFVALALVGVLLAAQATPSDSVASPTKSSSAHASGPTGTRGPSSVQSTGQTDETAKVAMGNRAVAAGPTGSSTHASTGSRVSSSSVVSQMVPTTVTTVAPQSPTINLSPLSAAPVRTENGWLAGPTSVSATYHLDVAADAALIFSGASSLTIDASCPSGNRSNFGPSPLSLGGLEAGCWFTITGSAAMPTTTYSLRLTPR